jgi:hypothetical protein
MSSLDELERQATQLQADANKASLDGILGKSAGSSPAAAANGHAESEGGVLCDASPAAINRHTRLNFSRLCLPFCCLYVQVIPTKTVVARAKAAVVQSCKRTHDVSCVLPIAIVVSCRIVFIVS